MKRLTLTLVLSLAACASSPTTHFYTLLPVASAHADPAPAAELPLRLGKITLPEMLDRSGMVALGPGTAVSVSDQDRWAAPLKDLVRSALTADLRDRLGASRVLEPGAPVPEARTAIVTLDVQRFAADTSGNVVLAADWTEVRTAGGSQRTVGMHQVTLRTQAASTRGDAVSSAMSRLLGELADRIADAG